MWRVLYPIQYFRLSNADKRRIDLIPTVVLAAVIVMIGFGQATRRSSFPRPQRDRIMPGTVVCEFPIVAGAR